MHAGCSAGAERLYSPSIKGGVVYSLEQGWIKTSIWKSYPTGQDVGLKFRQMATGSMLDVL